jgi:enamine deaminase RidA (YjgF/YER057c/UK114 family)
MVRRFAGPEAHEVAIVCRPDGRSPDAGREAEAIYRELAALLAAERSSFRDLASETLFLRDIRRDLPVVLDVRARILADIGQSGDAPLPRFVGQPPVAPHAAFELAASAVVPRRRQAWSVRDVRATPACSCEGCARSGARLVRLGEQTSLYTTNVYGVGRDAYGQGLGMFTEAERLLAQCGLGFGDVVRTWIHLRDIDRDYDALNRARRDFFDRCGIELRPASTGIQGVPFPDVHTVALTVHAVRSSLPLSFTPMSTPSLNEAWTYGAEFSRGLRLTEANHVTLHVSGTASIDEGGRTAHVGSFEAQADRMLHNVATLLAQQGAGFGDLVSGVTYLKRADDAPALRSLFQARGFDGFPLVVVEAPLCRPELLCETEAVAILPLVPGEA